MSVSYGKLVIVGAGKVGSAVLNSVLRMNIIDDGCGERTWCV